MQIDWEGNPAGLSVQIFLGLCGISSSQLWGRAPLKWGFWFLYDHFCGRPWEASGTRGKRPNSYESGTVTKNKNKMLRDVCMYVCVHMCHTYMGISRYVSYIPLYFFPGQLLTTVTWLLFTRVIFLWRLTAGAVIPRTFLHSLKQLFKALLLIV